MPNTLQLRIDLTGIEPMIWRRIIVPSSLTLTELHAVIQGAMGWEDGHLHMFEIAGNRYEIPEDVGFGPNPDIFDERGQKLDGLLSAGMKFSYIYDFGDDWLHRVVVEEQHGDGASDVREIRCVAGERACPPEDCGGPYGYPDLLDALADPDHPNHEEMVDWTGDFDPGAFNLAQANNFIQAFCAIYRKQGMGFGDKDNGSNKETN